MARRKRTSVFMDRSTWGGRGRSSRSAGGSVGGRHRPGPFRPDHALPPPRVPDRSHGHPTGGTEGAVSGRASFRARPHDAESPRGRTPSTSGCNGTKVGYRAKWPCGRSGSGPRGSPSTQPLHRFPDFLRQHVEPRSVGPTTRTDQDVRRGPACGEDGQHASSADLPQPSFELIPLHDVPPVLRHDESEPGRRNGGRRREDIQMRRPLALPPLEEGADLRGTSDACGAGEALPRGGLALLRAAGAYLLPTFTTRRARPLRRRRDRAARPPRVFILARNPCLLTRLRLRGWYVGFIPGCPIHGNSSSRNELEKIAP